MTADSTREVIHLPSDLTDRLQREFGPANSKRNHPPPVLDRMENSVHYRVDQVYENLPRIMSGPGEPRWSRFATIVAADGDLPGTFIGLYIERMLVEGPSGDYRFVSVREL